MSVRLMADVFADSEVTGNDRLVLLALADEADDDGRSCYPSQRRIAAKARTSLSTTRRCLDRLVEAGELVVENPGGGGRGKVASYKLTRGKGGQLDTIPRAQETRQNAPERAAAVPKSDQTHRPIDPTTKDQNLFGAPPQTEKVGKPFAAEAHAIATAEWDRRLKAREPRPLGDDKKAFPAFRERIREVLAAGHSEDSLRKALPSMSVFTRGGFEFALKAPGSASSYQRTVDEDREAPGGRVQL